MGITNNLTEITRTFIVYGYTENTWEIFEKGKHYEGFLLQKKM